VTTVHDGSTQGPDGPDGLTFELFIQARRAQRAREAEQLAERRRAFRETFAGIGLKHQQRVEELLHDAGLSQADRLAMMRFARDEAKRERATARAAYGKTVGDDRPENLFAQWFRARSEERMNKRDYLEYLKAVYREGRIEVPFDPVIVGIPGSRRSRRNGTIVYTTSGRMGEHELIRIVPETREVIVRATHEQTLEASIVRAHHEFGTPVHFESANPAWIARCRAIAERHGFESTHELLVRPAAGGADAGPGKRGTSGAAGIRVGCAPRGVRSGSGDVRLRRFRGGTRGKRNRLRRAVEVRLPNDRRG
jgi:hypothetical protein